MTEYEDHLIAFVDFLGFREADYQNDNLRRIILDLLTSLAAGSGSFSTEEIQQNNDLKGIKIRPAVSAFSDNVIISYPVNEMKKVGQASMMPLYLRDVIASIARIALPHRFLLRGGITIAPLYHDKGVVFGKGLIDAYKLESRVATYPRILVSAECLKLCPAFQGIIRMDQDGLHYLDYLKGMLLGHGESHLKSFQTWFANMRNITTEETNRWHSQNDLSKLAKWAWFNSYLERTAASEDVSIVLKETFSTQS